MAAVGTSNISMLGLKQAYVAGGQSDAAEHGKLTDGKSTTTISFSFFGGAGFTDGASVPTGSSTISISSHFSGKTFGAEPSSSSDEGDGHG